MRGAAGLIFIKSKSSSMSQSERLGSSASQSERLGSSK